MFVKDLESLKYAELRKLAKGAGIKANQKIEKLLKALKEHYIETDDDELKEHYIETDDDELRCPSDVSAITVENHSETGANNNKSQSMLTLEKNRAQHMEADSLTMNNKEGNKCTKKRRRTFDLDEPTLSAQNTPTLDDHSERRITRQRSSDTNNQGAVEQRQPAKKRVRKDTYNKEDQPETNDSDEKISDQFMSSPGTRAMIDEIDTSLPSAERKEKLLSALGKKILDKVPASSAQSSANQPSQIPRFMAFLAKKKESQQSPAPVAKDWTKIHSKEFSKFDSLDIYLEKKQQRVEKLTGSAKRTAGSAKRTPGSAKRTAAAGPLEHKMAKISKPVSRRRVPVNPFVSKPQAVNPIVSKPQAVKPFIPTVTSTENITFNFGRTTGTLNAKTPNGKTTGTLNAKTPNRKFLDVLPEKDTSQTPAVQISVASSKKSVVPGSRTTPYIFTGNNNANNITLTSSKKTFDLKASLAKPLAYKPHTGKLQSLDFNKLQSTSTAAPHSVKQKLERPSRQAMANKTRPINAKDVRRVDQLDRRNNQKYIDMMKRRGLLA